MTPYVKIPLWVYHAMEEGRITDDQFSVLCFAYYKADWTNLVVASYSAENLCRFLRLDATKANLKRFQRAERELQRQGVVRDAYRRGDKRPFHLWLPSVETQKIESLYIEPLVADPVADPVADATNTSHTESVPCHANSNEIVAASVADKGVMMSLKDHCGSSQFEEPERNPPKSPSGGLLPPRPVNGGHSTAVGLLKPSTGKATPRDKPLKSEQCKILREAAVRFCGAVFPLYAFTPDVKLVTSLLRKFSPDELLYSLVGSFSVEDRIPKNTLAYFFRKAAVTRMELRRSQGISLEEPSNRIINYWSPFSADDKKKIFRNNDIEKCRELWNRIFPNSQRSGNPNEVSENDKSKSDQSVRVE